MTILSFKMSDIFEIYFMMINYKWWTLWDSNPGRCDPRRFSRPVLSTNSAKDPHFKKVLYHKTGGATQIRTGDSSFAGCGLTTWRWHQLFIIFINVVPGAGLEPAQYCYRGILSPLRLPISPPGHVNEFTVFYNINFKWSGKRGSNSRPQPWQGCALPLSYSRNPTLAYLSK